MNQVKILEHLIETGDLSGALNLIEGLSQEERSQWEIQNLTGVICSYCGQFREAETFFSAALEQQADDINVMYNLADTCAALGKKQEAEALLQRCEQRDSEKTLAGDIALLREKLSGKKSGRVLMVSYYFPPLAGSGVFRSIKFAKYLPMFGWKPTVISTDQPPEGWKFTDQSMVSEIPDGMEVIRIPDGVSTRRETSMDTDRLEAILNFLWYILQKSPDAGQIFSQIVKASGAMKLLTFPCNALAWAYDTVQYLEENVDLDQFQAVYTTSGPSSAHLIGFYLKQKYGIPWVADFRDPWTLNAYGAEYNPSNLMHKLLFELESVLLKEADHSLIVVESLIQTYTEHFPISKDKISCITNGYDEADFTDLDVPQKQPEKFTINYSGLIYTCAQSLEPIFEAIRQLNDARKIEASKLEVRLVGTSAQDPGVIAKKYGLEAVVSQTGYLSHREALQANLNANLLLLLVGDEPKFKEVYTGKLFEYLRSGRPVLALAPKDGAVDQVLRETGHGEAFRSTQMSKIKAMILREYKRWEKGEAPQLLHSPQIERFERKALTKQLAQVLEDIKRKDIPVSVPETGGPVNRASKYLVICNGGYPSAGDPRCMFAHKRVLQYIKAGLKVEAFGFIGNAPLKKYEYQGVKVTQGGSPELQKVLQNGNYEKLLIHFVDGSVMSAIQQAGKLNMPMVIWGHGYEVLRWHRTYYCFSDEGIRDNKKTLDDADQKQFHLLHQLFRFPNIHFVFVSNWMANRVKKVVGTLPLHYDVIPNYIDCDYFQLPQKSEEFRTKILCIKSHASKTYAGDLTAKAIIELSHRDSFSKFSFELYGDGALFESDFQELIKHNFPNVHIHKRFLTQHEMKAAFAQNGVLLSPTRFDTQGVTACEAMSAGLAVISCNTAAVPEFIDEDCGSLYEFDNYFQLADEIEYLYYHPEEFFCKSQNAAKRVRQQCGYNATIKRELALIEPGNHLEPKKDTPVLVPETGGPVNRASKYLVISNGGYPIEGNPRCMFVHERVLQYIKAGLNVEVFGLIWGEPLKKYEYQGVKVTQGGSPELQKVLQSENYEKLLIHFPDLGVMYTIQEAGKSNVPMIAWVHGYEALPWYRCWFNYPQPQTEQDKESLEQRDAKKKKFLRQAYLLDNVHFIFVSAWQMERSKKFVGILPKHHEVIHNFINYEFFALPEKRPEDRLNILSVKNHKNRMYANDLTAKAILELSKREFFPQLTFNLYGDGALFEDNFEELSKRNFPNVHIHRGFLSHDEMREQFEKNGIFLSPTRMDSHQITTSEAMAAGLAVITSSAGPIREFMDEDCGSLFEFDNYWMMAEDIEYLYYHPEEFLRKSRNAVKRIREQCNYNATIKRELALIEAGNHLEPKDGEGKKAPEKTLEEVEAKWSKYRRVRAPNESFSSKAYWEQRYAHGGTSGAGSYHRLAEFKAEVINDLIQKYHISSIIEWGCGDGNQLGLFLPVPYTGYDVSKTAVEICKKKYPNGQKKFIWYDGSKQTVKKHDLAMSLDVIYHLVEDEVFETYMYNLFSSSARYVCIYSSNFDMDFGSHHKNRKFTDYVEENFPEWAQIAFIKNKFPHDEHDPDNTSFADFYIYEHTKKVALPS